MEFSAAPSAVPLVTRRPADLGVFEFVVVSTLRAAQLMRGCTPRIDGGAHKSTVIARCEVALGMVTALPTPDAVMPGTGVTPDVVA